MHLFADLALATSFLGVALGLFDYLADLFQRRNSVTYRLQTGAITFLPPLAFALFYPRGFVMALGYAGWRYPFLPCCSLLCWRGRAANSMPGKGTGWQVENRCCALCLPAGSSLFWCNF